MSKNLSATYYQKNKDYKKKGCKRYQNFLKKRKKKATIWSRMLQKSLRR